MSDDEIKKLEEMAHTWQGLTRPANQIETLLSVRDVARIFNMSYQSAILLIRSVFIPMGGARKIRKRFYISPWAVRRVTNDTGRCVTCGQRWTAAREIEHCVESHMAPDPVVLRTPGEDYVDLPPIVEEAAPKVSGPNSWENRQKSMASLRKLAPNASPEELEHLTSRPKKRGRKKASG